MIADTTLHSQSEDIDDDFDGPVRRESRQVLRLFTILELLSRLRFGATLDDIRRRQLEDDFVCERTTRRDIDLLKYLGFICRDQQRGRIVYSLNKHNPLMQRIEGAT